MYNKNNRLIKLYKRAWNKIGVSTPLEYDCGKLCDKKCCCGTETDGMLLFPGEEFLYQHIESSWYKIKESNITLPGGYKISYLICNGICPREYRPLSCRIFPVIPYINEFNRVDFKPDIRSFGTCPIVFDSEKHSINENFIDKLYMSFLPLLRERVVLEFIESLTYQYDEAAALLEKLIPIN